MKSGSEMCGLYTPRSSKISTASCSTYAMMYFAACSLKISTASCSTCAMMYVGLDLIGDLSRALVSLSFGPLECDEWRNSGGVVLRA